MLATINKSCSEKWKEHRRGLFHRQCSRAKSLRKDPSEDPTSVINAVMKDNESVQTKAMKHRISSEPAAKQAYTTLMKSMHQQFRSEDSGLVVHKDKSFISASPDLLVHCKCCGEGLCEVKCPESIKDQRPSPANVPYLISLEDGKVSLKKKHPYYYQIQGQMGILERKYCEFFVFTHHGHICVRETFDLEKFNEIMEDMTWFWENYIVDELLKKGDVS